ncbi:MAG: glycosyltransferase [Thermoplasmatales archaeon]
MKIAFFAAIRLNSNAIPGLEKWIINVSEQLLNSGHEVSIYGVTSVPRVYIYKTYGNPLKNPKVRYYEILTEWGKFTPFRIVDLQNIDMDVDLIYVSAGYYTYLKQILSLGAKTIFGFHNPELQYPRNHRQRAILNRLMPKFDGVHVLSRNQINLFHTKHPVLFLENTSFNRVNLPVTKYKRFTAIYFSRWEYSKGIKTVAYLSEKIPDDMDLIICGFGSVDIRKIIKQKDNVKVMESVREETLFEILQSAHVTIFPSYSESSLSLALNESLAHATPLIYRSIPQNHPLELISNTLNKVANSDDEFFNSLMELKSIFQDDPNAYLQKCCELINLVEPLEDYINGIEKFFHQVIQEA